MTMPPHPHEPEVNSASGQPISLPVGYPPAPPYPPGMYPGQMPGQFSQPYPPEMYPGAQPWPTSVATLERPAPTIPWNARLAQPLPLWARLTLVGVFILGLIAAFATGADWAAGGLHAGIGAGGVFILVALATGVRALAGMAAATHPQRGRQLLGAGLVGVILLATSGAGIGLQNPIHRLQALVLEKSGQFAHSINEYHLAGETVLGSHDIARVYDSWGEQATAEAQFEQAIAHFETVITTYSGATAEVNRAQIGTSAAYTGWGKQTAGVQDYANAVQHFDMIFDQAYCQASCQAPAATLDATAYYNLAEQTLANADYLHAVQAFTAFQTRFPTAPEAGQVHADAAKALLAYGMQVYREPNCSEALPLYTILATKYADTPQGKQAASAMKLPQRVIGHFAQPLPPHSFISAFLGRNLSLTMSGNAFYGALFAATPIQPDGSFAFAPQPQGTYGLFWAPVDNAGNILAGGFYSNNDTAKSAYYQATVGPLCPFDFGFITVPIVYQPNTVVGNQLVIHTRAGLASVPVKFIVPVTRRV